MSGMKILASTVPAGFPNKNIEKYNYLKTEPKVELQKP
jgi:hypothetical protein